MSIRHLFRLKYSVCLRPALREEDGSIANSGRWLQWHWKGQDAPGEARNDGEILAGIYHHLRELYQAERGKA